MPARYGRVMLKLQGIAVSPGVTIGEALVLDSEGFRIPRRFVARSAVDSELERLARAVADTAKEIERNRDAIELELGGQYAAIFEAHLAMLHDTRLQEELQSAVRDRNWWPEYAVSRTLRRYAKVFQNLDNHIAQRAHDIYDIEKSLLRNLLGERRETLADISQPVIVLAHNLTPSETANLDRRFVQGFATELGGPGSHTAIVAEGLEIPAVVGLGPFLADVSGGEPVILDGNQGVVILHGIGSKRRSLDRLQRSLTRFVICQQRPLTACALAFMETLSFQMKQSTALLVDVTALDCIEPNFFILQVRASQQKRITSLLTVKWCERCQISRW